MSQPSLWQLSIAEARDNEKKIVQIGVVQYFFSLLHGKSDSCVLIRFCGKYPALGSFKVVKTAPHKLQGRGKD